MNLMHGIAMRDRIRRTVFSMSDSSGFGFFVMIVLLCLRIAPRRFRQALKTRCIDGALRAAHAARFNLGGDAHTVTVLASRRGV
jgi:hypothetical protein